MMDLPRVTEGCRIWFISPGIRPNSSEEGDAGMVDLNGQFWSVALIGMRLPLLRIVTLTGLMSSAPALAQSAVTLPAGENIRDRPDQVGDVVLDVDQAGGFALNGHPVAAALMVTQL